MIPNIAVDNIVEKHIQALTLSGDQDWMAGGFKAKEWHKRKQSAIASFSSTWDLLMMYFRTWRNGAREREKSSAAHRTRTFIPSVIDLTAIHAFNQQPGWIIENDLDPTYEDAELIPQRVRRRRQRQQVTPSTTMVNNG
jgi:hypothetical protein